MPYIGNITQDFNVSNAMLDTDSVTSIKIVDGTIEGADIAANLDLSDSQKIRFGVGNDLQIYHDGSNSYIDNSTGSFFVRGDTIKLRGKSADEDLIEAFVNGSVRLYHNNSKKFETASNGAIVTGSLGVDELYMGDNEQIKIGAEDDFLIYHGGSENVLDGVLHKIELRHGSEKHLVAHPDAAVELYYDNSKKFETTSTGILIDGSDTTGSEVRGDFRFKSAGSGTTKILWDSSGDEIRWNDNYFASFGTASDLKIHHDSNNSVIDSNTGNLYIQSANSFFLQGSSNDNVIKYNANGAVELYYDNSKKFETTSSGVKVTDAILEIADTSCLIDLMEVGATDGNHRIRNGSGNFYVQHITDDKSTTRDQLKIDGGTGVVELYHNGTKKFETASHGLFYDGTGGDTYWYDGSGSNPLKWLYTDNVKNCFGTGSDLEIYHDGTNSVIQNFLLLS